MKIKLLIAALLGLLAFRPDAQAADTYKIDPQNSSVNFSVSHLVINTVKGRFNDFTGTVILENNRIQQADGVIQAGSIDTGIAARDKHLRSADFFDVEKFPTITFHAKCVNAASADPALVGDFTMHGVTKRITLPVTLKGPIQDPWGNSRIGLQAKATLNRKDFGLNYNKTLANGGLVISDEVQIEINAEAAKVAPK